MSAMLEDQEVQLINYAKQMADRPGDKVSALALEKMRSVHRTTLTAMQGGKTGEDAWYGFKGMDLSARSDRELAEKVQDLIQQRAEMFEETETFGQMLNDLLRKDKSLVADFLAKHAELDEQVGRSKNYHSLFDTKAKLQKTIQETC
jgi:DNA-directed RNA polymerase subunit L